MFRRGLGLAAAVILLDQATKWWVLGFFEGGPPIVEVTGFFNLVLVWNRGVSFGMLPAGTDTGRWLLTLFAVAVALGLIWWMRRARTRLLVISLGLVSGGALGNAIDRVAHGAVVDFLDVHAAGWHWPAFNVADSAITVGVVLLLVDGLFEKRR